MNDKLDDNITEAFTDRLEERKLTSDTADLDAYFASPSPAGPATPGAAPAEPAKPEPNKGESKTELFGRALRVLQPNPAGLAIEMTKAAVDVTGIDPAAVAKDAGKGVIETPRALTRAALGYVNETINTVGELNEMFRGVVPANIKDALDKSAPGLGPPGLALIAGNLAEAIKKQSGDKKWADVLNKPKSVTGGVIESLSKFIMGFIGPKKALGPAKSVLGAITKDTAAGAVSAATAFDPHEERLSNFLTKFNSPVLNNAVTQFLAADKNDPELLGRVKSAMEMGGLGAIFEPFAAGVRGLRALRQARRENAAAGLPDPYPETGPRAFDIIGDLTSDKPIIPRKLGTATTPEQLRGAPIKRGDDELHINFTTINTSEDVHNVIRRMAELDAGGVEASRRGVRTWSTTAASAEQENAWRLIQESVPGTAFNAEQLHSLKKLWVTSANKLKEVTDIAFTNPSQANQMAFLQMTEAYRVINRTFMGAQAEAGRALQILRKSFGDSEMLAKELDQLIDASGGPKTVADKIAALKRLTDAGMWDAANNFAMNSYLAKTGDAVKQIWINAFLLTNPSTYVVNAVSNTGVIGVQAMTRWLAGQIGHAFGRTDRVALGEAAAYMHGAMEGWKDAMRVAGENRLLGVIPTKFMPDDLPQALRQASQVETKGATGGPGALSAQTWNVEGTMFGSALDVLDTATQISGRVLQTTDELFKTIGYRAELHAQAARMAAKEGLTDSAAIKERMLQILGDPPKHIKLAAVDNALYSTFQNKPAEVINNIAKAVQDVPVIGILFMPFRKTPLNILTYSAEHSPLAPLVKAWRADIEAGGARADQAIARMLTGSMVMTAGIDMALSGYITGSGPVNPKEKQLRQRMGIPDYSIKLGDKWFAFDRLDPLGMWLGMAGDIAEAAMNADDTTADDFEEVWVTSTLALANNLFSRRYMSGVSQVMKAMLDSKRYGEGYAKRLVSSLVTPSGVAAAARTIDPYLRQAANIAEAIKRRTPWASKDLPMYRDLWGRPLDLRSGYGPAFDILTPANVRTDSREPIDVELNRLKYYPGMPPKKISYRGVTIDLSKYPHAYERYVELAGNGLKHPGYGMGAMDLLNAIVSKKHPMSAAYWTPILSDGPQGGRADMIKGIIDGYRNLAREQVVKEFKELQAEYDFQRKQHPYGMKVNADSVRQ